MNYREFKEKWSSKFSEIKGIFWAFSQEQFAEGMEKIGAESTSDIYDIGSGGFILKSEYEAIPKFWEDREAEFNDMMQIPEFAFSAFDYELANHEYCYSMDKEDALASLGLTMKDVLKNDMWIRELKRAIKAQERYMQEEK